MAITEKKAVVHSDPGILGGVPVFRGTRVPVHALVEYLESGKPLAEFLEDFPSVSKSMAIEALEIMKSELLARARAA